MLDLAIVIPAYKGFYFEETLASIANQSCKKFTLYIGNDSSPYNIKSIVDKYSNKVNIVYKRFDDNLGGKDLVAQWERCIDMVGDEDWIWLFSDDDIMESCCVERFYQTLKSQPQFDLYHFNVTHIDDERVLHSKLPDYPEILSSEEFCERILDGMYSFVVEYVFRKSQFLKVQRFQNFDLAWFSDCATWIKIGRNKGICTIKDANVYFRTSPYNITPIVSDVRILKRKKYAQVSYANWIYKQVKQEKIKLNPVKISTQLCEWFYNSMKGNIEFTPINLLIEIVNHFNDTFENGNISKKEMIFLILYKYYRTSIFILKKMLFWEHIKSFKRNHSLEVFI